MARPGIGLSLALAAALLANAAAAATRTAEEVARTAAEAIRGLDLQLDLPREPEPVSWHIPLPPELVVGTVILGALLLLYFFVKEVIPGLMLSSAGADWEEGGGEGGPSAPEEAVIAAEDLARQGRFVEAMHALLLQALAEIRRRRDQAFAESLTSREILRRVRLSEEGEASLRDIVARVEWSYFGAHPAGPDDYRQCRGSFDRLAAALRDAGA
ncbi:MAG TPA: DUF4129 domain-containing protein [Stellaceae bacterium]|nr:DUF4129 domain-containing protein [Stellaceae bacterium]